MSTNRLNLLSFSCAIQQFLIGYLFYTWQCIYVSPNIPIHPTPFSPLDVHPFVLYLCVSISTLQIGSSLTIKHFIMITPSSTTLLICNFLSNSMKSGCQYLQSMYLFVQCQYIAIPKLSSTPARRRLTHPSTVFLYSSDRHLNGKPWSQASKSYSCEAELAL